MARKATEKTWDWSIFILVAVLFMGGWGLVHLVSHATGIDASARIGVLSSGLATLSTLSVLAYWWHHYRKQGLRERPRISFREMYVLYFGMSVEVGLIVGSIVGETDVGRDLFSILLPPLLIAVIALMDDTPDARDIERARAARARNKVAELSNHPPEGPGSSNRKQKKQKVMARVNLESPLPPEMPKERGTERRAVANRMKVTRRQTQYSATVRSRGWLIMNASAPHGAVSDLAMPALARKKAALRRNPYEPRLTPVPLPSHRETPGAFWNDVSRISTALLNTATMALVTRRRPRCASTGA